MAQQTEAQAFEALAKFLNEAELDQDKWSASVWRDSHLIVSTEPQRVRPMYMVLHGKVAAFDFVDTTAEMAYVQLAGA